MPAKSKTKPKPPPPVPGSPPPEKNKGGRPLWVPSETEHLEALNLIRTGLGVVRLAEFFDKDEATVKRVWGMQLRRAKLGLLATAGSNLTVALSARESWATKFVLQMMFGRELGLGQRVELTGANGGPLKTQSLNLDPEILGKMSPDELAALETAVGRLFGGDGSDPSGEDDTDGGSEFARTINLPKGKLAP